MDVSEIMNVDSGRILDLKFMHAFLATVYPDEFKTQDNLGE